MAIIMQDEEIKTLKTLFDKFRGACATKFDLAVQWIISEEEAQAIEKVFGVLDDIER